MKRKVNLVGPSTLSISLPAKWAQRHGVKKGDELEVTEAGPTLAVSASTEAPARGTTLDVRSLAPLTRRAFDAIYKKGYDEVTVTYGKRDELAPVLAAISDEAKSYEIVSQSKDTVTIRSISELDAEEFDGLLKRTILLLVEMSREVADALAAGDSARLSDLVQLEHTNNRFTHILRRSLNRAGHPDAANALLLYTIIESLEKAADELKYLCQHPLGKVRKQTAAYAVRVADFTERFAQVFFAYTQERAVQFSSEKKQLVPEGVALLQQPAQDTLVVHHLLCYVRTVYDILGPLIAMRY